MNPCGLIPLARARTFLVHLSRVSCSGTAAPIALEGTRCSSGQRLLTDVTTLLCGKPCVIDTIALAVGYHPGVLKSQHLLWKEERGDCCTEGHGSLAVSGDVRAVRCAAAAVNMQISFLLTPPF